MRNSCCGFSCRNWFLDVRAAKWEKIRCNRDFLVKTSLGISIIFLFLVPVSVVGQNDSIAKQKPSFSLGLHAQYGFIIPHTESIRSISNSNPWGIEADMAWHFIDFKSQSYCNCFPRLGISFTYLNFDNPSILGHGFTMAPYVEPFVPLSRKMNFSIRFSAGAAYLDNVYHPVKNPENLFYSTSFSFILSLNPALYYHLFPNWTIRVAGNYNHISNGGNTQPNKGINFPTASIGFDYIFKPIDFSKRSYTKSMKYVPENSFSFVFLGTLKIPFQETSNKKLLYGLNFIYGRGVSRLSTLTAGFEYVNDGALKAELERNIINPPDHKRIGVLAGHELQIGRFSFSQQLGIYIYSPVKPRDPVYQRWGLNYRITDWLFFGMNLKAHRHIADFLDFRVGYIL